MTRGPDATAPLAAALRAEGCGAVETGPGRVDAVVDGVPCAALTSGDGVATLTLRVRPGRDVGLAEVNAFNRPRRFAKLSAEPDGTLRLDADHLPASGAGIGPVVGHWRAALRALRALLA